MKKKIINGILMTAMLFAGTTSFVSCKDNVDDIASQIYKDIDKVKAELETKIAGLDTRLTSLEGKVTALEGKVASLEGEVAKIQNDLAALDTRVSNAEKEIADLKARTEAVEAAVKALEEQMNNLITDVNVEETLDAVLGTINLPGFNPGTLASYYGINHTGIDLFPYVGEDCNVDIDAHSLTKDDIKGVTPVSIVDDGLISGFEGNVGKVYFTVNPNTVDASKVNFSFVNSLGQDAGLTLSDVQESNHLITWALGKHGNGIVATRGENGANLYEATVTRYVQDLVKAKTWNLVDIQNFLNLQDLKDDAKAAIEKAKDKDSKKTGAKSLVKEALQIIQNYYNKIDAEGKNIPLYGLKASWTGADGVEKSFVKDFSITSVAIEPLSYNTFWTLDKSGKAAAKNLLGVDDFDAIKGIVYTIAKATDSKKTMDRVKNYLDKESDKLATFREGHEFFDAVAPIILFIGTDGVNRLVPEMTLKSAESEITFILTSPTEEYLVPAAFKYVAVKQGGKVVESHLEAGNNKIIKLTLPMGASEIVYSTVDYAGYTVTKRYPITRVE